MLDSERILKIKVKSRWTVFEILLTSADSMEKKVLSFKVTLDSFRNFAHVKSFAWKRWKRDCQISSRLQTS